MDTALATEALKATIEKYGTPDIFNSDYGNQYTSLEHTKLLKNYGIQISMNSKDHSSDNISFEDFFRTLKYYEIYINDYQNIGELRNGNARYMHFYNFNGFHSVLGYRKPVNVYLEGVEKVA